MCRPALCSGLRYEIAIHPGFEILGYADYAAVVLRTYGESHQDISLESLSSAEHERAHAHSPAV